MDVTYERQKVKSKNFAFSFVFILIFFELLLGGGGDLFSFNVLGIRLTLRIVLFFVVIISYFIDRYKTQDKNPLSKYVFAICLLNLLSLFVGVARNGLTIAINNYLSSLYLVCFVPFISFSKKSNTSYSFCYKVLLICASIISIFTLVIFIICNAGIISVYDMKMILREYASNLGIRENGCPIYPSQTFVMIAGIFIFSKMFFSKTCLIEKLLLVLFTIIILLTTTRGLIISYGICLFLISIYAVLNRKISFSILLIGLITIVISIYVLKEVDLGRILSFDDQSIDKRNYFISEGLDILLSNPLFFIFGSGFGTIINGMESTNLEISLFEIFLKQGLLGVVIWLIYVFAIVKYIIITGRNYSINKYITTSLFFSIIAIFVLSFTNPYLNNTVGIIWFFVSITIIEHEKNTRRNLC